MSSEPFFNPRKSFAFAQVNIVISLLVSRTVLDKIANINING